MTIDFIAMIHHRHAAETRLPVNIMLDHGNIRDFAEAAAQVAA